MDRARGTGWLLLGILAGVLVPVAGLDRSVPAGLSGLVPLPWSGLLSGGLVFALFAAIHFRSHWMESARRRRETDERLRSDGPGLAAIADDLERTGSVLSETLQELQTDSPERVRALYLDGAFAHVARLHRLADGLRAVARARDEER